MKSTKEVLEHHQKALKQGDINEVMSDYAPGAVLFTKDGTLNGSGAIRHMFEMFIAEFETWNNLEPETAVGRRRLRLCCMDGRDYGQCLRDGHRHICHKGRQDRRSVFH